MAYSYWINMGNDYNYMTSPSKTNPVQIGLKREGEELASGEYVCFLFSMSFYQGVLCTSVYSQTITTTNQQKPVQLSPIIPPSPYHLPDIHPPAHPTTPFCPTHPQKPSSILGMFFYLGVSHLGEAQFFDEVIDPGLLLPLGNRAGQAKLSGETQILPHSQGAHHHVILESTGEQQSISRTKMLGSISLCGPV